MNESLSNLSSHKIDSIIQKRSNQLKITNTIVLSDELYEEVHYDFIEVMAKISQRYIVGDVLPPSIRGAMLRSKSRFAVAVIYEGFERSKKNMNKESWKSFITNEIPHKIGSKLTVMIFDVLEDKVIFNEFNENVNKHPLDEMRLTRGIDKIIKKFYKRFY